MLQTFSLKSLTSARMNSLCCFTLILITSAFSVQAVYEKVRRPLLIPYPRVGRSDPSLSEFSPRGAGGHWWQILGQSKRQGLIPFPRIGKRQQLNPYPRIGEFSFSNNAHNEERSPSEPETRKLSRIFPLEY
ncbi:uncharacterized protein LOC136036866 [Artemia franciscana]|uniref:uncharacterized protein LOC136036866 n=1 Tax=Artemia franciscana TaxID=6661 RepID=UPI0032DA91F9